MNPRKLALARILRRSRLDQFLLRQQHRVFFPYVRAVNYHDIPPSRAPEFENQLRAYRDVFDPVGPRQLSELLSGDWGSTRPGILLSFDDGLRSHTEVVAPLLESYGMTGWFMIPGGFLSSPIAEQASFAAQHSIGHEGFDYGDPRVAMTWEDLRGLSRRHAIGCHTWNHQRLGSSRSREELDLEVNTARSQMEDELGIPVRIFAWVGGEEESYSRNAAAAVAAAGYEFSFMTNNYPIRRGANPLWLQRTNIEASDPMDVVRFQLSGVMDIRYGPKRRRIASGISPF